MVLFYFSGTGNSEYLAKFFGREMKVDCHSIEEEEVNHSETIKSSEIVVFCYPIYGSRVPRNMRQFIDCYIDDLQGKKLIIFATQWLFSGDGARVLTDLFPKDYVEVIYAEHFNMPNNISNTSFLKEVSQEKMETKIARAEARMLVACENIKAGIVRRRGFSSFSKFLGAFQGIPWQRKSSSIGLIKGSMEDKISRSARADDACISCSICVKACPARNLRLEKGLISHNDDCLGCYRCVNICPERAISVMLKRMPKWQYECPKEMD